MPPIQQRCRTTVQYTGTIEDVKAECYTGNLCHPSSRDAAQQAEMPYINITDNMQHVNVPHAQAYIIASHFFCFVLRSGDPFMRVKTRMLRSARHGQTYFVDVFVVTIFFAVACLAGTFALTLATSSHKSL